MMLGGPGGRQGLIDKGLTLYTQKPETEACLCFAITAIEGRSNMDMKGWETTGISYSYFV